MRHVESEFIHGHWTWGGGPKPRQADDVAFRLNVVAPSLRYPDLNGQAFPNNTIPADRIDPVARQMMEYFPLPNAAGASNYFRTANTTDNAQRYLGRVDLHLSAPKAPTGERVELHVPSTD